MQHREINESIKSRDRLWSGAYNEKVQQVQNFTDFSETAHTLFAKQDFE